MKIPVAAALAAFACGVVAVQFLAALPSQPWTCVAGAAALALAAGSCAGRPRPSGSVDSRGPRRVLAAAAVVAATGLAGFGYAAWRADARLDDALSPSTEGVDLLVTGIVDDLPQNSPQGARFAFAVESSNAAAVPSLDRGVVRIPGRLSLAWFAPRFAGGGGAPAAPAAPTLHAGERWRLAVRLRRPHGNVNPAGFDLEAWLLENNLRATGYVRDASANARLAAFVGRPADYVQRARESIRARIVAALPDAPYAGVLVALAIGDQRAIPERQWLVFNRTGIAHLVSISGLHVTVFAALAGAVAGGIARRHPRFTTRMPARKLAALAGAAFAFGYVLLAGAEVPAVRTLLMLWVAAGGVWLARPGTATLVWLWSLAAVLVWDPWASLAPGFWLSFGAVGLLLYAGAGRLEAPRPARLRERWIHALREGARTQWVVTIGLVPGTLALFAQLSLVSALANAVAIPVVTLGIVPLALCGIAVPLDLLWQAAHMVLALLMRFLEALAGSPAALWAQHAPRPWTVIVAMLGIVVALAPRGVPGRALGFVALAPLFLVVPARPPEGAFRITVLDVGQGLAVTVETHGHTLLYDTGPRFGEASDAGGRIVAPYLRAAGLRTLDTLVVSHQDLDHSGGALSLLQTVPVATLYSSLPADAPIVTRASARGTALTCQAGQRWTWDGVAFEVIHPPAAHYASAAMKTNDLSCVVRIDAPGGSALLTGDIEAVSEALLLRSGATLAADVLVVPHHGSRTSSTAPFIAAVAPRVAIFTAGYRNRFEHPRPDVVARYRRGGAALYRTDLDGAVTIDVTPGAPLTAIRERERSRRYWHDAPLAGTAADD